MPNASRRTRCSLVLLPVCLCLCGWIQEPESALKSLVTSGEITMNGQPRTYRVRHLPPASFPDLLAPIVDELNRRGCLIPQTYQAHRPENVVRGSFHRPGSSDWALLCSTEGKVSLLVFFDGLSNRPAVLATASETERVQVYDSTGVLGFDWGIDVASPQAVHEAQIGLSPRPPRLDHDALADSVLDRKTVYRYFSKGEWSLLDMPD